MTGFVDVAAMLDVPANKSLAVEIGDQSLLVCNSDGQFVVVENRCPHQDQPLTGGRIQGGLLTCPFHAVAFRLSDGKSMGRLTRIPLVCYPTRVEAGIIQAKLRVTS